MKYKFDKISNLNEMKEICFYIKAINEANQAGAFNKNDLMPLKNFIENKYNLEMEISKLYLFVEKIYYISGKSKLPESSELEAIINGYIKYNKNQLKETEISVLEQQLNLKDKKYRINKNKYLSAEELSNNISAYKKMYVTNNNWLVLISAVVALFVVSLVYVIIGCTVPQILALYISKSQEISILCLTFLLIMGTVYVLSLNTFATNTKEIGKKVANYFKYAVLIDADYNRLNVAELKHKNKLNELSVNGIELSDQLLFNFLKEYDVYDIASYNFYVKPKITTKTIEKNQSKARLSSIISSKEQDYNWLKSKEACNEKENINAEIVSEIGFLTEKLIKGNLSTTNIAKEITNFYCNEVSVEKRKSLIDDAQTKIELVTNYLNVMEKINSYKNLTLFTEQEAKSIKKYNIVSDAEKLSTKGFIQVMCDRIEKAGELHLITEGQYDTYKNIKKDLDQDFIYGINLRLLTTRVELYKFFAKLYKELKSIDTLN